MIERALSLCFLFTLLLTQFHEASLSDGSQLNLPAENEVEPILSYHSILVAIAALVCLIVVLFGCTDLQALCARLCPQQGSFRDIDEDGYFNDISIAAAPAVQFPMYPPVESTPESRYNGLSVYFEPLPDISARRRNLEKSQTNSTRLRPKVSQLGFGRMDSEDWEANGNGGGGGQSYYDHTQELAKLEKLVNNIRRANSRNQFPRTQLQYIKELGSGWFGKVLEGEGQGILPGHKKTKVVVQMLKEDADQYEKLTFLQEGLPYREIQDPNVIKLFSHCVETSPFLMILEYCPVDLKTFMQNHRTSVEAFDRERLMLNFACDMVRGLQAMHQQNYIHRDFALRNCLVSTDRTVKVGDYGLSEELFKEDYYFDNNRDGIPIRWLAPEVVSFSDNDVLLKRITKDSNIWSFGVTLWELVKFGTLPYTDLSNENVLRLVILEMTVKLSKPDVPISNLDKLYQLMQRCWSEASQRPSIRELLIMLLHLQTQTDRSNMSEFDLKWNQLMPRETIETSRHLNPHAAADQNYAYSTSNGTITTIAYSDGSDVSGLPEIVMRPTSFGSEFSELNASLLAEAGSLQASLRSASGTPDSPPSMLPDPKSPVNEMSLAAELDFAKTCDDKDSDDQSETGSDDRQFTEMNSSQSRGFTNTSFVDDKSAVRGATIQHQAEVHKAGADGDQLLNVLGNVNQSFSLDFLSEGEETDQTTKENQSRIASHPNESLQMDFDKSFGFSPNRDEILHRDSNKNSEQLFNELMTSTPKVTSRNVEDSEVMASNTQSESIASYAGSVDQSSIAHFEERSFMQPQKYTAYLQTVTTSVEGDESEAAGDLDRNLGGEPYQGLDANFGDFLNRFESDAETAESSKDKVSSS